MCGRMPMDHESGNMCEVCACYWEQITRRPVKDAKGNITPYYLLCEKHSKELDEKGFVVISTVQHKGKKIYKV